MERELPSEELFLALTAWAKAHPGGYKVLHKFHNRDATKAFDAAHHSANAVKMLQGFWVGPATSSNASTTTTVEEEAASHPPRRPRWMQKLFTKEDPIGVHKYLGLFCLGHFVFRFANQSVAAVSFDCGLLCQHPAQHAPCRKPTSFFGSHKNE